MKIWRDPMFDKLEADLGRKERRFFTRTRIAKILEWWGLRCSRCGKWRKCSHVP
ncbi:MAG: hypothetical protein UW83_C0001G0006 [Parcubacteria group bacterium GW2011_GWD1_44_9]|nr:MAG: hypothetical protein UW83_C0001G0006 [Parcubacteria group bacterium GW2011_GWD1_44_9]